MLTYKIKQCTICKVKILYNGGNMEIEKNIAVCNMIDVYGRLLTDKQNDVMKKYFYYDNSLAEIAEELGTTRQAVSDLISRTVTTLEDYEKKLRLVEKNEEIISICNEVMYGELSPKAKKQKINEIIDIVGA